MSVCQAITSVTVSPVSSISPRATSAVTLLYLATRSSAWRRVALVRKALPIA